MKILQIKNANNHQIIFGCKVINRKKLKPLSDNYTYFEYKENTLIQYFPYSFDKKTETNFLKFQDALKYILFL